MSQNGLSEKTAPVFVIAGFMHPLAVTLIYLLLPDREFTKAAALQRA
jgi:hypothetical protein